MTFPWPVLPLLLLLLPPLPGEPFPLPTFAPPNASFQHLLVASTGDVYVGATNAIHRLGPGLAPLATATTENPPNLPNPNRLLLETPSGHLLTCGQRHHGLCQARALADPQHVLATPPDPGEGHLIAAPDAGVPTVAVAHGTFLWVARGSSGTRLVPPLTVRHLEGPHAFSGEGLGRLVVGDPGDYGLHYVLAAPTGTHAYFLLTRRGGPSEPEPRTYAARACLADPQLYSYVEVPLDCQAGAYPVARAGALRPGQHGALFVVADAGAGLLSALCVFPLEVLEAEAEATRQACYSHGGGVGIDPPRAAIAYGVTSHCTHLPQESSELYPCGDEHTPSPIVSLVPIQAPALVTELPQLTAVVATEEAGNTIIFLGDAFGQLHKVFIEASRGSVYSTVRLSQHSPISPDLLLDKTGTYLYAMTESQVTRLPVSKCPQFPDCTSCLGVRDPFCGWCVLQGRCRRKLECVHHEGANQWLWSYGEGSQCLQVESVMPANQSRGEPAEVMLQVPQLPLLAEGKSYHCAFGSQARPATRQDSWVRCLALSPDQVPPSPEGKDHVTVELSVMFEDVLVVAVGFAFYDCSAVALLAPNAPCTACVSSPWGCHWCPRSHCCITGGSCPTGEVTIYNQNASVGGPRGSQVCPRLGVVKGSPLVPVGVEVTLDLEAHNLNLLGVPLPRLRCVLEVGRGLVEVEASPGGPYRLQCGPHAYDFGASAPQLRAPVYVTVGERWHLDAPSGLHVMLYDCSVGRPDCSRCRAASPALGCQWCPPGCQHHRLCPPGGAPPSCPAPFIHQVHPLSGPPEGGLLLTIAGSDLGQRFEDVAGTVRVAGRPCLPDPARYRLAAQIVCQVPPAEGGVSGPVEVAVGDQPPGVSIQHFTYQDPQLWELHPRIGPVAGGTQVTVTGEELATGPDVAVFLGDLPCSLVEPPAPGTLVCLTTGGTLGEAPLRVQFGKVLRHLTGGGGFHYAPNPNITWAWPRSSFCGGGRIIQAAGTNLDVPQQPRLVAVLELPTTSTLPPGRCKKGCPGVLPDASEPCTLVGSLLECGTTCSAASPALLLCPSPAVPPHTRLRELLFQLDGLHMPFTGPGGGPFTYAPDPQLHWPLGAPPVLKPGMLLHLEGEGLTLGTSKEEVVARVGAGLCVVKTLTPTHLYCEPPPAPPGSLQPAPFVVEMGHVQVVLGPVHYEAEPPPGLPPGAQAGLGVGATALVLVVVLLILMYRRKSKQALQEYKKVLVQLENLEVSVGDQCRKEFTDLMTEMTDLGGQLEAAGIPFLDYGAYALHAFFPGPGGGPGARPPHHEGRSPALEQGLAQLSGLLNNRTFLLTLVHTLEAQASLSRRERLRAASLLGLGLGGRLELLTDVLAVLLGELVQRQAQRPPRLLLRRTETMVEKLLTDWLSVCLYPYLREVAGEPLYLLYRAIRWQVDEGPVDAVTGRARRTLSEAWLLREDVGSRPLTLRVLPPPTNPPGLTPARVLDTDTVGQAKEKILEQLYKGLPHAQRPPAHSLDLEWRSGVAGHLTLSDLDVTSVTHNQWKRLNTLQHYKVPDGATVALIPRLHNNSPTESCQSPLSGDNALTLEDGEEGGIHLWHLEKPAEEPEGPGQVARHGSRERDGATAIPEIYLTRLLSTKGMLHPFVEGALRVILPVGCPPPLPVKFLFDLLDELAARHGLAEPDTLRSWKNNSLLLRFWVRVVRDPRMLLDVRVPPSVDASLGVVAQTLMDACTAPAQHQVGRDSPVNKLLYAREIPRYRELVDRYYAEVRQAPPVTYQEMNAALTKMSQLSVDLDCSGALLELYEYVRPCHDQLVAALEAEPAGQKQQLGARLQQAAALLDNKVTDL
ncbi:plexin-B3 isoform X1 [Alligator sinensis]|uniref:Plexin-B3 isoform X1 n=1 Tax=Alligator sinensis TaxID=38654 RepID=A0A3Q0HG31_ALLSI|nr:plexin-B3 isoform X1 [Alligator sinensis]